jgi:anti-sigma regulatory factor (Ser/Thr protein kinase)
MPLRTSRSAALESRFRVGTIDVIECNAIEHVPAGRPVTSDCPDCHSGYQHEAFFYAGPDEFMAGTVSFIREALAGDEAILVVLAAAKITRLREELEGDAERVLFADMAEVGANPARIIPAWQDFVDQYAAPEHRLWGIGEPIWAGRSPAELAECQRHEELLNVVFSDPELSLLCPYDIDALDRAVIERARRSHRLVRERGARRTSPSFAGVAELSAPFDESLPNPPGTPPVRVFATGELRDTRRWVNVHARDVGLTADRTQDLLLAVNEVTTNSVMHGGGGGTVSVWREGGTVVCEVRDHGRITDPLAGRRRPSEAAVGGRGLWIANQVCDLVQVRTFPTGAVVRIHMRVRGAGPH